MDLWIVKRGSGDYDEYREAELAVYASEEMAKEHARNAAAWHTFEVYEPCRSIEWELDSALDESDRLQKHAATNPFDRDYSDTSQRTYWVDRAYLSSELPKSRLKRYLAALAANPTKERVA
jgi:hypothetical protein